jgi:post-segregation antitoxin (ccd killing protein)
MALAEPRRMRTLQEPPPGSASAKRRYGGNVSALVAAIAKEAHRQSALEWLLQRTGAPEMTDAERDALLAEIDGTAASKRRRRTVA